MKLMSESKLKSIGKIIAVVVGVIIAIVVLFSAAFIIIWNHDSSKEYHYTTEYGDEFTVSVDSYPGKANMTCNGYRFSCRIQHYNEGDQIVSLCDTPNITCYEIDGIKICKMKESSQMVILSRLSSEYYKEQREELERILQSDEEAKKYIELPKIKEVT